MCRRLTVALTTRTWLPEPHLRTPPHTGSTPARDHLTSGSGCKNTPTRDLHPLLGERLLERVHALLELFDTILEREHPADPLEAQPLLREPLHLPEALHISEGVAARVAPRSLRYDEPDPVVLAKRLRVHLRELGRRGDRKHR